jgi:hypothetical protein
MFSLLKSTILIGWRLADYGMLPVHILALLAVLQKKVPHKWSVIYCSYILVNAILMLVFLQNTIAHRYFFVIHALGILLAYQYISSFSKSRQIVNTIFIIIFTVAGNFLYYPGKTLGDATLAYRSYFELEKIIRSDLGKQYKLHSLAPIGNSNHSKYLSKDDPDILRLNPAEMNAADVILQSNINADFDTQTIEYLKNNWHANSYEAGAVYVNVFLNPQKAKSSSDGWKLREPGAFEKQMIRLKKTLQ